MWQAAQNDWYRTAPSLAAAASSPASPSSCANVSDRPTVRTAARRSSRDSTAVRFLLWLMSGPRSFFTRHGTLVHGFDDIQGGEDGAFHPRSQVTQVLAGQVYAAVGLEQGVVVVLAGGADPAGGAAERPGHAVPADGEAGLELLVVLRVHLAAVVKRPLDALFRRHARNLVRDVAAVRVRAEHHTLLFEEVVVRVGNLGDRQVGARNTTVNAVVFLPEAALELQPHLGGGSVRNAGDCFLESGAEVGADLAEDGQRNRADAVVARRLFHFTGIEVLVTHAHLTVVLTDFGDFGAVADQVTDLAFEACGNPVHPAHGLEHREGLVAPFAAKCAPGFALQEVLERLRGARNTGPVAGTHVFVVTPAAATRVLVVAVECTPRAQGLEQALPVFAGEFLVERTLTGGLGQQLGGVTHEVGRDRHAGNGFAVVVAGAVNQGVAVVVDENLQVHSEPAAVIKQCLVTVRNAPRAGVEVLAILEVHVLHGSAQLLEARAAAH